MRVSVCVWFLYAFTCWLLAKALCASPSATASVSLVASFRLHSLQSLQFTQLAINSLAKLVGDLRFVCVCVCSLLGILAERSFYRFMVLSRCVCVWRCL